MPRNTFTESILCPWALEVDGEQREIVVGISRGLLDGGACWAIRCKDGSVERGVVAPGAGVNVYHHLHAKFAELWGAPLDVVEPPILAPEPVTPVDAYPPASVEWIDTVLREHRFQRTAWTAGDEHLITLLGALRGQMGEHERVQQALAPVLGQYKSGTELHVVVGDLVAGVLAKPVPAATSYPHEYEEGRVDGGAARFVRCREDIARALGQDTSALPSWEALVASVRALAGRCDCGVAHHVAHWSGCAHLRKHGGDQGPASGGAAQQPGGNWWYAATTWPQLVVNPVGGAWAVGTGDKEVLYTQDNRAARQVAAALGQSEPHPSDVGYERDHEQRVLAACEALGMAHVQRVLDGQREAMNAEQRVARPAPLAQDTSAGFDRPPARYTRTGREAIDVMRDRAHQLARRHLHDDDGDAARQLADALFAYHCEATAMKYEARAGAKGDPGGDAEKALWYRRMAAHARGYGPDPRHERPGFEPYRPVWGGEGT